MATKTPQTNKSEATQTISFLASLDTLATPVTDITKLVSKDPLVNTRAKYVQNCDESIKAINSGVA